MTPGYYRMDSRVVFSSSLTLLPQFLGITFLQIEYWGRLAQAAISNLVGAGPSGIDKGLSLEIAVSEHVAKAY